MPSVLITGASRGIGRATACRLAANGWDVLAGVRAAEDGDQLAEDSGGRIRPVTLDIADAAQIAALDGALPQKLDHGCQQRRHRGRWPGRGRSRRGVAAAARDQRGRPGRRHPGRAAQDSGGARAHRVRIVAQRPGVDADEWHLLRFEVRARGAGGRPADGVAPVARAGRPRRAGPNRHRHVAHAPAISSSRRLPVCHQSTAGSITSTSTVCAKRSPDPSAWRLRPTGWQPRSSGRSPPRGPRPGTSSGLALEWWESPPSSCRPGRSMSSFPPPGASPDGLISRDTIVFV